MLQHKCGGQRTKGICQFFPSIMRALGIDRRLSGLATSHLVGPYWWSSAWLYQKTCSMPTVQFFSILYPFKLCSLAFQNRNKRKGAEGRCKGNGHAEELRRRLQSQTRATALPHSCFVLSMFGTIISSICSAMALWSGSVEPLRVLYILLSIILFCIIVSETKRN